MAIRVKLNHRTEYRYDRSVNIAPHVVRLRPAPHCRTPIHAYSLRVEPQEHFINWQQDPFGNYLARLVFPERARRLVLEVDVVADMTVINPFDFFLDDDAQQIPFTYPAELKRDLAPYLETDTPGPLLREWLAEVDLTPVATVDFLVAINQRLQRDVGYVVRMEPGVQSCEQTLSLARGSCRDSGWLLVQILRRLGLAARFVSGYLVQLAPDVKALDGPAGPSADFTDLHAWAEVYVPGAGWIGMDPTSGLFAGEGHIPLACTPGTASAAPVTGATDPCEVEFHFHNIVERIHEDPRVTKPYSDAQWDAILALGDRLDEAIAASDLRLTLGGEPTFVSIDDMDGAQWNTAALGEDKSARAAVLVRRLWDRFASGGVLQHGQGKWYPGEPLPRWALSLLWRTDGETLWRDRGLLAGGDAGAGHGDAEARRLIDALARRLGVDPAHTVAGYEDVYYYLWKEGSLPENVDPFDSHLDDPLERKRLVRLLESGLASPTGYALPLIWDDEGSAHGGWRSGRWHFRRERMYLSPGDSPMGLRLPLDALPWEPPEARQVSHERDPFEAREALRAPAPAPAPAGQPQRRTQAARRADATAQKPPAVVRSALCVEPRAGRLHVFLPPLTHLEHWVDLLTHLEAAAAECGLPVLLEGYEPPRDPRLQRLQVTPDPGVIEVNIHPASSWRELVENTEVLYEEARQARLGAEKFMLDGRHTGTGGGNHATLGGATPADSPFLRRPDLLASLVLYWQHHPSLSYLFSGMFVGPTSQAPRLDEARDDSLYEFEIALGQLAGEDDPQPWRVDRLFRNLLTDLTGNTHRAEFCIDKLYSPDSASGRQGLVEFRAFEMPPHARMSLAQMLLLRALVVRFWHQPYRREPERWGTELHDRFLLPHWMWADFQEVIAELREAGHAVELDWYAPFHEFRFPVLGRFSAGGVEVELRQAIEPWHVLGEETTAQGTARFVDSSVERLQVTASGLTGTRHVVTCNGRRLPLRTTGQRGEFVAGVRYKAWQPPSGLHPTIPSHAPLVFDVVDTWNDRSLGGCTYHVAHPGGRNYETFPVNANEAEARRIARFAAHGHSPGRVHPPDEAPDPEHPYTLDLRRRP